MAALTALQRLMASPKTARFVETLRHADLPTGWADDPEIVSMAGDAYKELGTGSPFWKATFGNSKIVDAAGAPKVVYHGTARGDRVGDTFLKERATSGPMAFFTDNREVAENYAKNKADTSISREGWDNAYEKQFVVDINGKEVPAAEAFYDLPPLQRANIRKAAPEIGFDDEGENIIRIPGNKVGTGGFADSSRGTSNPVQALFNEWLNSGNLYNNESQFTDVLKLAGLDNVKYKDPNFRDEKVFDVFINSQRPFDTSNINKTTLGKLQSAARREEKLFDPDAAMYADHWDKTSISPLEWVSKLNEDIANGTTYAWTQVPDWVTEVLKKRGYDSIKDLGGKYTAVDHTVHIPFEPTQIKSVSNRGTFNPADPNIYRGLIPMLAGGGALAAMAPGSAQASEAEWPKQGADGRLVWPADMPGYRNTEPGLEAPLVDPVDIATAPIGMTTAAGKALAMAAEPGLAYGTDKALGALLGLFQRRRSTGGGGGV